MTSGSAKSKSILLRGIPVSPGIYVGRVVIHDAAIPSAAPMKVPASQVEQQIRFLESALARTREEISQLQAKIREALDEAHAAIFDPHLLFVDDPLFKDGVVARIRGQRESAPYAVMGVIQELAAQFAQMKDQYISSRATDVIDVGNRICKHLAKSYTISPAKEKETSHTSDMIIFAHDLSPSDTAQMDHRIVKAFAMEIGGPTSHTAILAKGLEIPAVVGLGPVLEHVGPETTAIVDGYEGTVIVHPTAEEIRRARDRRRRHLAQERTLNKLATLPAETLDGYRVELSANLELPDEIPHAVAHGADGVGLFRTEFLYFNEAGLPEEDRQFDLYKNVLKKFSPRSVIFRTLDIGGDKFLADFPGVAAGEEANPFLGLRAIRFCLRHPGIFRTQLRAILRASAFGRARIMFPMVSSAEEVRAAKKILEGVKKELADEGKTFDAGLEVGIMVEIPSAALIADQLAIEADFFSIGTNDLIQYTLAVDRANERVASLYDPYHPAVLRLIRRIIDAAHRAGIWVGVCGEMASNPRTALLLVGMGIDELSMGALSIPEIKHLLRNTRLSEARRVASEIYALGSSEEIRTRVEEAYQSLRKVRGRGPDGNGTA